MAHKGGEAGDAGPLSAYALSGETCENGAGGLSAPIFAFRDGPKLSDPATILPETPAEASFALTGRSAKLDPLTLPVRGDLAHVRLAGKVFVPHYAVPMPHAVVAGGATLRKAAQAGADVLANLAAGTSFDVLDMSGGWAWGELVGANGAASLIGYIPLGELAPLP